MKIQKKINKIIKKTLYECSQTLSADYFTIVKDSGEGSQVFTTYPKSWIDHYDSQQCWNQDVALSQQNHTHFLWGENCNKEHPEFTQLVEDARDFSIGSGLTIHTSGISGVSYHITLASQKSLKSFKKDISVVTIGQAMKYGIILDEIFSEDVNEDRLNKIQSYIDYDKEIYKRLQQNHSDSVAALNNIQTELSFSAHSSSLDTANIILDYWKKKIVSLDES